MYTGTCLCPASILLRDELFVPKYTMSDPHFSKVKDNK